MQEDVMTEREILQKKISSARVNLLLAILLTVVNVVLMYVGSGTMLLFSISFPYYMVIFAALGQSAVLLAVAAASLIVYFICWLLSKKRTGWLLAAAIFMVLDTLFLAGLYLLAEEVSGIMDVLFHIWIMYYLFSGYGAAKKLKKLPPEPEAEQTTEVLTNSAPIRRIDENEKCRVLLEAAHGSYRVCYRRVKKTNQLVINDYIYDEMELTIEPAHCLKAVLDGHQFEVGYDGHAQSYFKFDGNQVAKKTRWY